MKANSSSTSRDNAFPSLVELSLDETVKSFPPPLRVECVLKPDIALILCRKLPPPTNQNLGVMATYVENDEFWKRACNKGHTMGEDHVLHKRMFFEQQLEGILKAGGVEGQDPEAIIAKMQPIADYIHTVSISSMMSHFPIDVVCSNLPNLMNINLKHAFSLVTSIPKALAASPFLTTLILKESQISDDDLVLMLDPLVDSSALLHLDLGHNKITSQGTKGIADRLIASSESILSCLDLSGNKISSEGASALGLALVTNESLLSLTLRLNNIGDEGGKDLFEGLVQNSTLRHLNLSANKLGSSSAMALLDVLTENKSEDCALESIALTSNEFSEEELLRLSQNKTCYVDIRADTSEKNEPNGNGSLASEMPCSK
ncbi:hypothetical protein ACHAXR_007523 [Thalassiosira sp. AJA248-18]